jgi:hypothetical protein
MVLGLLEKQKISGLQILPSRFIMRVLIRDIEGFEMIWSDIMTLKSVINECCGFVANEISNQP